LERTVPSSLNADGVVDPSMNSFSLIVLAGGLASRLGSDKALHPIAGKPMIKHIVERLAGLADEVIVVIARNASRSVYLETLPSFTRLICDEREGKSPLIGIMTGLRRCNSRYAAILSCDVPLVNKQVIQLLVQLAPDADAVIPRWSTGRLEPLEAVYRTDLMLHAAEQALAEGYWAPKDAIHKLIRVMYLSVEDQISRVDPQLKTFFNVNTREDALRAQLMFRDVKDSESSQ
jgi:molybdopterin-guanine dinucleotide biosynthesis protein A